jgi:hypothetical protein
MLFVQLAGWMYWGGTGEEENLLKPKRAYFGECVGVCFGRLKVKLASLILAQNERWRRA